MLNTFYFLKYYEQSRKFKRCYNLIKNILLNILSRYENFNFKKCVESLKFFDNIFAENENVSGVTCNVCYESRVKCAS